MAGLDTRSLEIENAKLTAKLEVAEKAIERANLERSRVQNDAALAKAQCDEQLQHARRQEAALREASQRMESDLQAARLEARRSADQSEKYALEARKRMNELEVERDKAVGHASGLKKALDAKTAEIDRIVRESEFTKENLERVVRELADRIKRSEEDNRRKNAQTEKDVEELLREHQRTTAELMDSRRTAQTYADDIRVYESQLGNLKHMNQDLIEELDNTKRRARSLEADVDEARIHGDAAAEREAALKDEVADLLEKLAKADGHLQRLTTQAEELQVENIRLKHEMELCDDDVHHAKRDKDELVTRLTPFMVQVADDTDRVTSLIDSLLAGVSALSALNSSNVSQMSLDGARGDGSGADGQRAFTCWPKDASNGQPSTPEGALIVCSMRLRDALALIAEDIIILQRGVNEETFRKRDGIKKDVVMEEALQAERAHILDLATKLGDCESRMEQTEAQRKALEQALADSSQWMSEAVSLQEDRTRRVENLLVEKDGLQATVAALEGRVLDLSNALRQAKDATEEERDAVRKATAEAKAAQRMRQAADDEVAQLKRQMHGVKAEVAERENDIKTLKQAAATREEAYHRLDTDLRFARRQLEEAQTKARIKDETVASLEARETQLRDQLYETQKRLEVSLRGGAAQPLGSHNASTAAGFTATTTTALSPASPLQAYRGAARANASAHMSPPAGFGESRLVHGASATRSPPRTSSGALQQHVEQSASAAVNISPRRTSPVPQSSRGNSAVTPLRSATTTATTTQQAPPAAAASPAVAAPAASSSSDAATTERLRAWESRINALLANNRATRS